MQQMSSSLEAKLSQVLTSLDGGTNAKAGP